MQRKDLDETTSTHRKDLAIWTSPAWAAVASFLFLGGGGWGMATTAATVANDLASDGRGHLQEHVKRAFLTRRWGPAGSEVALEEWGRGPDLEGQCCGEGAAAGGACTQRPLIRVWRAMV
jgi:hypothetical protein